LNNLKECGGLASRGRDVELSRKESRAALEQKEGRNVTFVKKSRERDVGEKKFDGAHFAHFVGLDAEGCKDVNAFQHTPFV
jgi:hypothetical protein